MRCTKLARHSRIMKHNVLDEGSGVDEMLIWRISTLNLSRINSPVLTSQGGRVEGKASIANLFFEGIEE